MTGFGGNTVHALEPDALLEVMERYGRGGSRSAPAPP